MGNEFGCEKHRGDADAGRPVSRRDFIRATAVGAAGAALAGSHFACSAASNAPRMGLGAMFTQGDKPLLVAVEGDDLAKMLEAGLDAMGGLEKLVAGRSVVLKPNLVASQPAPVTTPIDIVVAVGKLAQEAGAASTTACDCNSKGVAKAGKFEAMDYPARLKEAGIAMDAVDFGDRLSHVFVDKKAWLAHPTIGVVRTLHEADTVISLPMIKRHDVARFTCALKNHFGSVYGPLRFVAHRKIEREKNAAFFDNAIAEFADAVRPELNIVDGRSLLIRNGPTLQGAAAVKSGVNRIILCGDMVATDVYCAQFLREHDDTFSTDMISLQLEAAEKLGLGVRNLSDVVIKEIIA
jgi:uncharacterized protein (DUF362 family)